MSELPVVKSTATVIGLSKRSPYTQIAVGTGGGFLTGYTIFRVSKLLAIITGGTILVLQLAVEADIIKIDWNRDLVKKMLHGEVIDTQAIDRARRSSDLLQLHFVKEIRNVVSSSFRIYVSFLGGFLLGFGCA